MSSASLPQAVVSHERKRAKNYPIARWYLRPLAETVAEYLAGTSARPIHFTLAGLGCATIAATWIVARPAHCSLAGCLVLAAWFCDRTDGLLARRQASGTPLGGWLDANIDELVDLGLHIAMALAAHSISGSSLPIVALVAFLGGKYLLMYGLGSEPTSKAEAQPATEISSESWLRGLYHLPANADVRIHLCALAILTGQFTLELAVVAAYYNLRWLARYALVYCRWQGVSA